MTHLDLFSGIGGFAYAADQVFGEVEHIFVEIDPFCQKVLTKHWPESEIYDDIRTLTANTESRKQHELAMERQSDKKTAPFAGKNIDLLTGGFPCQPFSAAGLRRGTSDERHLWPEMFRVIRLTKPEWVIAENVGGLATWNNGMVLEQVCLDLESENYEVWPFIIPAAAVGAPHRRDRIWFIGRNTDQQRLERPRPKQQAGGAGQTDKSPAIANSRRTRLERRERTGPRHPRHPRQSDRNQQQQGPAWSKDWAKVAAELCSVDDGLPIELDGFKLSKSRHRAEQLKAYGNAIVPQVAVEIMKGMS